PAERSQRIEQLYHAARECDPNQRAAFLEQASSGDESLRREVESLLAEDDGVQSFLETPAQELMNKMSDETSRSRMPGSQVASLLSASDDVPSSFLSSPPMDRTLLSQGVKLDGYVVESLLGSGGMGDVYRARDLRLNRDVAIKVLPPLFSTDPDRLRR